MMKKLICVTTITKKNLDKQMKIDIESKRPQLEGRIFYFEDKKEAVEYVKHIKQ